MISPFYMITWWKKPGFRGEFPPASPRIWPRGAPATAFSHGKSWNLQIKNNYTNHIYIHICIYMRDREGWRMIEKSWTIIDILYIYIYVILSWLAARWTRATSKLKLVASPRSLLGPCLTNGLFFWHPDEPVIPSGYVKIAIENCHL